MQTIIPTAISTAWFNDRKLRLSELRVKLAIKQQQAHQIESAIRILADTKIGDETAMAAAEQRLSANIGP